MNDDRPVGGGMGAKGFPAASDPAEDFSKLSVDQLLVHANWKARKEGYDKIAKDPKKYRSSFFDKIAKVSTEGNAAAQESLFDALVALVSVCDSDEGGLLCEAPLSLVMEKAITGRPKAISSGQEFVTLLVENGKQSEVFNSVLPAFAHKAPKNRMAAVQLCTKLVSDFGTQHFPIKAILKAMQPLFNDANPQVRKEAVGLCCQCYKYIGAGIKGFLTDLRDVQLQELEKQFESVTLGGTPSKQIKGVSPSGGADGKRGGNAPPQAIGSLTGGDGGSGDIDDAAFELLDESPVIPRLPKKFFPTALDKNTSWQDRCEYVTNTLLPLLSAPRLRASDNYHELAAMMKIYLTDPQAPLMLLGFQMIQECARGLRGSFASCAKAFISPLFDKMKDKKTSVLLHIMTTLEKLIQYHCITMDQCNDEMEQVSQSKNPSQRVALVNFCTNMVTQLDSSQFQRLGRSANMLKRMVNDEKSENRDAAYVLLGKLVEAFGEAPYRSVLASMDDKQKTRMQIVLASPESQTNACGGSGLTTPKGASATPSNSPAKKLPRIEDLSSSLRAGAGQPATPNATFAGTGSMTRRVSSAHGPRSTTGSFAGPSGTASAIAGRATVQSVSNRGSTAVGPSVEDPISLESTLPPRMEAANLMLGLLNGDTTVQDLLRSREWSQRLDGMLKVKNTTDQWSPSETTRYFNALVVYLRSYPGFKESTFQVFQAELNVLNDCLSKLTALSHAAGYAIVAGVTPRLTEMKNRQAARDMCSCIGQRLGVRFVIRHMIVVAKEVKTPKLMQECNEFFIEMVDKCADSTTCRSSSSMDGPEAAAPARESRGAERLDVRGMMDYIKHPCYDQTAPPVRTSSMQLLLSLHRYDSAAVRQWIQSFPPQVVAQFEQVASASSTSQPTTVAGASASRRSVPEQGSRANAAPASSGANGAQPPQAPLAPRSRPSGLSSTTSRVSMSGSGARSPSAADGTQKRYRAASHSPGPGARARPSSGAPPTPNRPSQRVRSSSARPSAGLGASGSGSATNRTPLDRSLDAGSSEVLSSLRPVIREITNGLDWRDRLDAVHKVDEYLDNSHDQLPPSVVAPLLKALGSRFDEANKNFVVDVLRTILRVVEAGGYDESRTELRRLMPGALALLGDQKTMLREEARKVVFLGMDVCGLDTLLQGLQRPLSSDSNIARQNTLEAMLHGFENQSPESPPVSRVGLQLLLPAIVKALMDRIQEVRVAAEQVIGYLIPIIGDEPIVRHVHHLKPAEQQVVMPAVERQLNLHPPPLNMSAVISGSPVKGTRGGGNEEGEADETDEMDMGRPAGVISPKPARTPRGSHVATPVSTPRRAGQLTPRKTSLAPGSGESGSRSPSRPGSAAPQMAASGNDAAAAGHNQNVNGSFSMQRQPGSTTPKKVSARRPSISLNQHAPSGDSHAASGAQSAGATTTPAAPRNGTPTSSSSHPRKGSTTPPPQQPRPPVDKDHSSAFKANEEMYSIAEIQLGLRSATPSVAYNMCADFMKHFRAGEDCGTPEMMQLMVERLGDNTHKLEVELALGLIGCLSAMYMSPRSAQRCHNNLLFRMLGTMFDCLLSEQFSLNENVLKSLNNMTLKLLEGCPVNDVFSALVSRMTSYSTTYLQTGRKGDLKYIQVTVKCLMRVDLEQVSPDNVILCCHEYLLQHPPSSFRNLDDLPIRTVKTVLQTVTRRCGQELLTSADRLVGPQNLVTHFIRACLESRDRPGRSTPTAASSTPAPTVHSQRENNEKNAAEESLQQQRASQSPAPKTATPVRRTTPVRSTPVGVRSTTPKQSPTPTPTPTPKPGPTTTAAASTAVHADPAGVSPQSPMVASSGVSSSTCATSNSAVPPERKKLVTVPPVSVPVPTPKAASSTIIKTPKRASTAAAAATAGAASSNATEELSLATVFAHIRHHTTSQQGIDELYTYLKTTPVASSEEEFGHQFLRCSDAFRQYIKRKIERKIAEDPAAPSNFTMPSALANLA